MRKTKRKWIPYQLTAYDLNRCPRLVEIKIAFDWNWYKQDKSMTKRKKIERDKLPELVLKKSDLPIHKITARRMLPKLPPMTKQELREMLAQAARNTAEGK